MKLTLNTSTRTAARHLGFGLVAIAAALQPAHAGQGMHVYGLDFHCGADAQTRSVLLKAAAEGGLVMESTASPSTGQFMGLVGQSPATEQPTLPDNTLLELVVHYKSNTPDVPIECTPALLKLSEEVKSGKKGRLLIRASTSTASSTEMELALASERLEQLKLFLRNDRVAVRALQTELLAKPAFKPIPGLAVQPRVIEIYSSPVN